MITTTTEQPVLPKDIGFLRDKKGRQPISMLTCYDYPTACLQDAAGIDIVFVGDSVGTNVLGYASEQEVTMADMLHHLRAVRRGVRQAFLLVDLPYRSYETPAQALENATLLLAEGAGGVKLEGGLERAATVRALAERGVVVCGHIGFTPQTLRQAGRKARVQGRSAEQAKELLRSALALEQAGAQLLVLELVPEPLARLISGALHIPTIGIGAGRFCDGQVLIVNDVLGLSPFNLRFVKRYQRFDELAGQALAEYRREVEAGLFPAPEHSFAMDEQTLAEVEQWLEGGGLDTRG